MIAFLNFAYVLSTIGLGVAGVLAGWCIGHNMGYTEGFQEGRKKLAFREGPVPLQAPRPQHMGRRPGRAEPLRDPPR